MAPAWSFSQPAATLSLLSFIHMTPNLLSKKLTQSFAVNHSYPAIQEYPVLRF